MVWQPVPVTQEILNEVVRRIIQTIHPQKIVMFGSRARGEERRDSDLDILVIASSDKPRHKRSPAIYGALRDIMVPMDVVVYTPDEVEEWKGASLAFVTTALREGKVLYEN